jgi:hypothetical protein
MASEDTTQQQVPAQAIPLQVNQQKNILDQTLGDILQNNPQAQQMIMNSMGISQEKFQGMLASAQQNNLMHMKISDLFKNGIVQQAQGVVMQGQPAQLNLQQMQQISSLNNIQNIQQSDNVPYALPNNPPKKSLLEKFRDWLTLKNG